MQTPQPTTASTGRGVLAAGGATAVPRWVTRPGARDRCARGAGPGRACWRAARARPGTRRRHAAAGRARRGAGRAVRRARRRDRLRARRRGPAAAVSADRRARHLAGAAWTARARRARAARPRGLPGRGAAPRAALPRPSFGGADLPGSTPCWGWPPPTADGRPALRLRYRTRRAGRRGRRPHRGLPPDRACTGSPPTRTPRPTGTACCPPRSSRSSSTAWRARSRELPDRRFHELFEQRVRTAPGRGRGRVHGDRQLDLPGAQRAGQPARARAARPRAGPRGRGRGGHRAQPRLDGRRCSRSSRRAACTCRSSRTCPPTGSRPCCAAPSARSCSPSRAARPPSTRRCCRVPAGAARAHRRTPTPRTTPDTDLGVAGRRPTSSPTSTSPPAPPASPRAPCASTPGCSTTSRPRSTTWRSARARPSPRPPRSASTSRSGSWSRPCWSAAAPCSSRRTSILDVARFVDTDRRRAGRTSPSSCRPTSRSC